jgi:hypothetical protein
MRAGGVRSSFALGGLAAVYMVALVISTRVGLGLGLDELATVRGSLHPSVSYRADLPPVFTPPRVAAAAPAAPSPAPQPDGRRAPLDPALDPILATAVVNATPVLTVTEVVATASKQVRSTTAGGVRPPHHQDAKHALKRMPKGSGGWTAGIL